MSAISEWSTSASNNNAAPPDGWPEGQAPSTVNNCAREMMAAIRTQMEQAEWFDWGDTVTYVSGTQFTVPADLTARYQVGRRIRVIGSGTGTIYGTITASAFTSSTAVTVAWDSGSMSNEALTAALGIASVTNPSIPADSVVGLGDLLDSISSLTDSNGNEILIGGETASAVNEVTVTNAATGGTPAIAATGDDTNIDLNLVPKGTGKVQIGGVDLVTAMRGHIDGLVLSNGTDAAHDIHISAGEATAADQSRLMILASGITKRGDATWVAGTGNGGLSSSLSALANNTWYHVHEIVVSGAVDVGFDTSVTAANLITDHSATAYRRIGSFLTDGSANILAFIQNGEWFWWSDPPLDVDDGASGTSGKSATLSVPTGVTVTARVNMQPGSTAVLYVSPLAVTNEAASPTAAPLGQAGVTSGAGGKSVADVLTNTSGQIRYRTSISDTARIATLAWHDPRGRNA